VPSLNVIKPYDEGEDAVYYARREQACAAMIMVPGLFALFGPNDAHMPRLHAGAKPQYVTKAVMKIRLDMPATPSQ